MDNPTNGLWLWVLPDSVGGERQGVLECRLWGHLSLLITNEDSAQVTSSHLRVCTGAQPKLSLDRRQKRPETLCRGLKQSGIGGWVKAADSWGQRNKIEEEGMIRCPVAEAVLEVLITLFWVQRGIWLDSSLETWGGRMWRRLQRKQTEWRQVTCYLLISP